MDLNGNGITVSKAVMEKLNAKLPKQPDGKPVHPIEAMYLKSVVDDYKKMANPSRWAWSFQYPRTTMNVTGWLWRFEPGYYAHL